ncbi:DUF6701 domain-containing protein [Colwellia sp. C1TZA3]|uniref:DUF6701 domain-containing protein n=1 Tax=Colwellia sp. C1TZA3 TaxID=2508879 RepID=UPI0011B97B5F|nr:DUF6701 domain-containing protein [Colwellia sp. C1TZA3]TWX68271.1 DUF3494 domain-containing protein [Colwellia sp. C1TZA3]
MHYTQSYLFILTFCAVFSAQAAQLPPKLEPPLDNLIIYSSAAVSAGADSVIAGNILAEAAGGNGARGTIAGNLTAGGAISIGANSAVGGDLTSGAAITTGASSAVTGNITATAAITLGDKTTVGGNIRTNIPYTADDQSSQIEAIQAELAAIQAEYRDEKGKEGEKIKANKRLDPGVHHTLAFSATAGVTLTFVGSNKGVDDHWLINSDTYIKFAASTKVVLENVTPNSTITWNAKKGLISTGADAEIIGSFFASTSIATGARTKLKGIGGVCPGLFTATGAVEFGANSIIGPLGCKAEQPTNIDHYEIVHDGQGLTCAAETVTIKACTNAIEDGSCVLSDETVTLDVKATGPQSSVFDTISFTGKTTDIEAASIPYTLAKSTLLSIENASIPATASNNFVCNDGNTDSCDLVFTDAGFRFLSGADNSTTLPNQTAGSVFAKTLKLQAVKNSNGVCTGLFNGNVDVDLWQENIAPGGTSGLSFNMVVDGDDKIIAKQASATPLTTLTFGDNSIAIISTPIYHDAGQISLHAEYNVDGITLSGSSNAFWVSPAELVVSARIGSEETATKLNGDTSGTMNLDGATPTVTHKAGKSFTLTVSALNSLGVITPNYLPGAIQLKLKRTGPKAHGVDGALTYGDSGSIISKLDTDSTFDNITLNNFSSGISTYNAAQYSEVGLLNLDVQDSDYNKVGTNNNPIVISATDINIGRFTPAYFKQSIKEKHQGNFDAVPYPDKIGVCRFSDWAYTGQRSTDDKGAIAYSLVPKITITAYNANNAITQNYTLGESEGFMKLLASGVDISLPTHDKIQQVVNNTGDEPVAISAVMHTGSLSASPNNSGGFITGEWLYTFSTNDHFSYHRDGTSLLAPFAAKIPFVTEQVTDSDGIKLAIDPLTDAVSAAAIEEFVTEGVQIRFARMVLQNAFGSENTKLRAQLNIEVYDDKSFKIHTDESCLTPLIGNEKTGAKYSGNMNLWDYRLIDIDSDKIQVSDTKASASGVFYSGMQSQLFFSKPEKQGALEWEYEVPNWLKFKWNALDANDDGNFYDDNPSAALSFGQFRGNDRVISWQEVFLTNDKL